jgi:hypothetical protein
VVAGEVGKCQTVTFQDPENQRKKVNYVSFARNPKFQIVRDECNNNVLGLGLGQFWKFLSNFQKIVISYRSTLI